LRRAEEHFAQVVAGVRDYAIISTDLDGVIVSWNQGAEWLYGYTAAEVVGRPLSVLAPPDHTDEIPEMMERIRRGDRIHHLETVRMRKDGRRLDVSLAVSPVANAEGRIVGASKIARDIAERKRTEADLRFLAEASKLLAELLDVPSTLQKVAGLAVPHFADWCAVDLLGPDGSLRRLAVAHADPAKVELAREWQRRYPPDPGATVGAWNVLRTGRPELMAEIPDALLAQPGWDEERRRILRELGLKSYMGVPLAARGRVLGVLTFIAAESGRRYDTADLRLAEDLAHRAAIAVENARLYSELKEADRRKDEFLAMLSHELRNPLAPIRNALHIMTMPGANHDAVESARQMTERQVKHLSRLVDDLLGVSRIMRGKIELRREPVDLAAVIGAAVETAHPALDAQGQELIVSFPPEPLLLEADATRLTQVVANLLNNAAKFSDQSGHIWLSAERQGADAVVRVRDEGVGIRADLLPHVFDLFVQEDHSLERTRGGLGIGLTVARKLVELHGGTIAARSGGPGKGSEFVVRLPVRPASAGQPTPPAVGPPARADAARRVLVVDDIVDVAESTGMLLRLGGHEVRLAHNGPEALQAAAEFRPDVVVLDIGLPGMSGYEVARRLRQRPEFLQTLLIAVTGYGQEEDRRRTEEAGFDRHLTKPVNPTALEAMLRE
jgi:PAS domain S-box-containing protein